MIGKLQGLVDTIGEDFIILDVNGVGYEIFVTSKVISNVEIGEAIALFIYTKVSDDAITLIGFESFTEKKAFNILTSVQGVGSRVAIAILSDLSIDEIDLAISTADSNLFKSVSGIGPKLAERIITELKGKSIQTSFIQSKGGVLKNSKKEGESLKGKADLPEGDKKASVDKSVFNDAQSALLNFGYKRADALRAVSKAYNDLKGTKGFDIDLLIKEALKNISKL